MDQCLACLEYSWTGVQGYGYLRTAGMLNSESGFSLTRRNINDNLLS